MIVADVKKSADQKMHRTLEALKADLGKIRTGRAHTGILDHIQVDYYGNATPLTQVANLSLLDARTISVTPWEKKMVPAIEKAIRESGLGLNPSSVGDIGAGGRTPHADSRHWQENGGAPAARTARQNSSGHRPEY